MSKRKTPPALSATTTLSAHLTSKIGEARNVPGQPPELSNVCSTWCSSLDIVNINGHNFQIRDLQFLSDRPVATIIHINRPQLERLIHVAQQVLAEGS